MSAMSQYAEWRQKYHVPTAEGIKLSGFSRHVIAVIIFGLLHVFLNGICNSENI